MTSANSMHEAGYPKLVHWDNPEGWGGEGIDGGWGCWDTCTLMADSCQCMAKTGEGNGSPLQYSCLGNPMDRGAWWATVHGVAKSQTQLSGFTFTFHFHVLEMKWQPNPLFLPGESQGWEPTGLPSLGPHRVGHYWRDLAAAAWQKPP